MSQSVDVLIVGAGPTGLVMALWLTRSGVRVRIIDKDSGPGETSRALAVQARTLEFYRQLGIADDVVAGGIQVNRILMRSNGREIQGPQFGEIGKGLSPFPFPLMLPQDLHERVLIKHLEASGVHVERRTELTQFSQDKSGVTATVTTPSGPETIHAQYLCGCDGARSVVRHGLGIDFPGGTYSQIFYVADVQTAEKVPESLQVSLSYQDFCIVLPVRQSGSTRLIGIVPEACERKEAIGFDDVRASIARDTGLTVTRVNWFSTYHVHHRVADRFRVGRVFLCGDAAHIHSPAGGQGMNTGIGDAVNLAWKLADVVQGQADVSLLNSYELERLPFARTLVATTDRLFQLIASRTRFGSFWRGVMMPRVMSLLLGFEWFRHFFFKMLSQIRINYRSSPLSHGRSGKLRGGDRLPWVETAQGNNFDALQSLDWQIHIYGDSNDAMKPEVLRRNLPLYQYAWSPEACAAGLCENTVYIIRPDGYIADIIS